jgi:tRNA-specific 2-thiouridylase
VDTAGRDIGTVSAIELVTVGQRRGLPGGGDAARYALDVDMETATVVAGSGAELQVDGVRLRDLTWVAEALDSGARVGLQSSAHGEPAEATHRDDGHFAFSAPQRKVAPGQTVAIYRDDEVVGAGVAL